MKFTYLLISPVLGLVFSLILNCEAVPIGKSGAKQVDLTQYQNLLAGSYPPVTTSEYSDYYNSDPLASLYLSFPPENFDPYQQPILSSPYYTLQNQVPDYLIPTNYPYGYSNNLGLGYNNVPVQRPNYAYYESPATATSSNNAAALDTFKSLVECVQEKLQTMETLLAKGKPVIPVNENNPALAFVSPAKSNLETANAQESEQTTETIPTSVGTNTNDQGDVGVQVSNAIKQLQALVNMQYKKAASTPANPQSPGAVNHGRSSSDVLSPYFGYLGTSSPYGSDMVYGSYPSSSSGYQQQQYNPYQTGAFPYEYYTPGTPNYGSYLSSSYAR